MADIKETIEVTLTDEEVSRLITTHVASILGKSIIDVEINITDNSVGSDKPLSSDLLFKVSAKPKPITTHRCSHVVI